jgi:hypothetical protein
MVCSVKGLMKTPILRVATNVGLFRTNKRERGSIKFEQSSCRREYCTLIFECTKERHSFKKENKERGSNTTIRTSTPDVSRRPRKNLHKVALGMPTLANGLVGEVLNESPNFQGYNQCGISRHTNNGEMKY